MPTEKKKKATPFKLGLRWKNNPVKIYYFFFTNIHRLRILLDSDKCRGAYEWGAIYYNSNCIEIFNLETGWNEVTAKKTAT